MEGAPFPTPLDPALQRLVDQARGDLAARLGGGAVDLVEVRPVRWPDRGLGCPEPGMIYPQVPQAGLLIRLRVAGRVYQYHVGEGRPPFLCERPA